MYYLSPALFFPPVSEANKDGILLLVDLTPARLQLTTKVVFFHGLKMEPIIWWSPNPRMVLFWMN
jgi:leucyl/phenylalanyl-tRNA--protein transferase